MVLKGNQRGLLGWAVEVFRGMEGGRLPGETEAAWRVERDGEVWRGVGAWVLAVLRGYLVSLLHRKGVRGKKAALEAFSFHPLSALKFLGLYAE